MQNALKSCFRVTCAAFGDESRDDSVSGSAVAVYRDSKTSIVYLATTASIGFVGTFWQEAPQFGAVVDAWNRRYTDVKLVVYDLLLDISILRVVGVPNTVPVLGDVNRIDVNVAGDSVYAVGTDPQSVTRGTIMWPAWSSDIEKYITVDISVSNGNHGGGVFSASKNQLVGIVSRWSGTQAILIPSSIVYKTMLTVQYEAPPQGQSYAVNRYFYFNTSQWMYPFAGYILPSREFLTHRPSHPLLSGLGCAGMIVGLPHESFRTFDWDDNGDVINADIIWAVALPPKSSTQTPAWSVVTADEPFMALVEKLDAMRPESKQRKPLTWRSSVSSVYMDVARPVTPTFTVLALVSSIVDRVADNVFRHVALELKPVKSYDLPVDRNNSSLRQIATMMQSWPAAVKERIRIAENIPSLGFRIGS